jgi:hypothetical protein
MEKNKQKIINAFRVECFKHVNNWVVNRNLWLNLVVLKFSQAYTKKFIKLSVFQICAYYSLASLPVELFAVLYFFTNLKFQNILALGGRKL